MDKYVQRLLDERDITDTLVRYGHGIDRADADLLRSVYHPDAVDNHGPFTGGPEEFITWALGLIDRFEVSQHRVSNVRIEILGDRANVHSYLTILHVIRDTKKEEVIYVRMLDLFEKRDGLWKISNRTVVVDYSSEREGASRYFDEAQYVRPAPGKNDPSYRHKWYV